MWRCGCCKVEQFRPRREKDTEVGQQILDYERRWGLGTGPEENRTETITRTTLNYIFEFSREPKPEINIGTGLPGIYSLSKLYS